MVLSVHPQLLNDCHLIETNPEFVLLLHKDAALHWFILVPNTKLPDLLDLPQEKRSRILDHCEAVATLLKATLSYPKVNVAALGNVVPQLHIHIIGRKPSDACWPKPVWGNLSTEKEYAKDEIKHLTTLCKNAFNGISQ
jgi:diadenosine tetraphosphate (Ap4A) HIT family hydrolase